MDAIVLAAGLGSRFHPMAKTPPKPLWTLGGESLLGHTLNLLKGLRVEKVVVVESDSIFAGKRMGL